jgi:polyphosphate kinase 2 (PPK2 family)
VIDKVKVDVNRRRLEALYVIHRHSSVTMQAESSTAQATQRGLFIVLEGLDRCGKSTQVDRLVAHLNRNGREARLQKFPGGYFVSLIAYI